MTVASLVDFWALVLAGCEQPDMTVATTIIKASLFIVFIFIPLIMSIGILLIKAAKLSTALFYGISIFNVVDIENAI